MAAFEHDVGARGSLDVSGTRFVFVGIARWLQDLVDVDSVAPHLPHPVADLRGGSYNVDLARSGAARLRLVATGRKRQHGEDRSRTSRGRLRRSR